MSNEQILQDAEKALNLFKLSRPGAGDMESRRRNRQEAKALIEPYLKKRRWPAALESRQRAICEKLIDLI
jgi:hypothetical protein